jgi:hypothetical protein
MIVPPNGLVFSAGFGILIPPQFSNHWGTSVLNEMRGPSGAKAQSFGHDGTAEQVAEKLEKADPLAG